MKKLFDHSSDEYVLSMDGADGLTFGGYTGKDWESATAAHVEYTGKVSRTELFKFKVTGWQSSSGAFPETWFGIFEVQEQKVVDASGYKAFKFIEMAMSPNEINDIDEGLKEGNDYFFGVACEDTNCDFSKAMPVPKRFTPLSHYYDFLNSAFL